jgi:co-chaperonin GroES (HSP10)
MNITPMQDKVLVAEKKKEDTTESGIIIEGVRGVATQAAVVLAIGPKVTEVKVGDTCYVDWAKSQPVKIDGAQRAIIKEEFILAVVE